MPRYYVTYDELNEWWSVIDRTMPFKVRHYNENDELESEYSSGCIADFATKQKAHEYADRLNLRQAWGV